MLHLARKNAQQIIATVPMRVRPYTLKTLINKFCLQVLPRAPSIRTEGPTKEPSIGAHKRLPTSQDGLGHMLPACVHEKLLRQCKVHHGETLRRPQASTFPRAFTKQRLYNCSLLSITPSHCEGVILLHLHTLGVWLSHSGVGYAIDNGIGLSITIDLTPSVHQRGYNRRCLSTVG
jgi:hypothetical protein